jgi:hypothetical protein
MTMTIKFWTLTMPDGNQYALITTGKASLKSVAVAHNLPLKNVKRGANDRLPPWTDYKP